MGILETVQRCQWFRRRGCRLLPLTWIGCVVLFLWTLPAFAQEELRPSSVGARLDPQTTPALPGYNLKVGPLDFTASASLQTEFNDNVSLSTNNPISDEIITPTISLQMFWQLSPFNSIQVNTAVGYMWYINHPEVIGAGSAFTIAPDSEINFKAFVGQVTFNFYDRFSLEQDPATNAKVSNVPQLGEFVNSAGVDAFWRFNPALSFQIGFNNTNLTSTNSTLAFDTYSENQLTFSSRLTFHPSVSGGLEGSVASTAYQSQSKPDSISTNLGPFLDIDLSKFTHLRLAGGYQMINFQGNASTGILNPPGTDTFIETNTNAPAQNQNGFYFNGEISNQLTTRIQQKLSAGRELSLSVTADSTTEYYLRYSVKWQPNRLVTLGGSFSFENGSSIGELNSERYKQYVAELMAGYKLSDAIYLTFDYRYVSRASSISLNGYDQNIVSLSIDYRF